MPPLESCVTTLKKHGEQNSSRIGSRCNRCDLASELGMDLPDVAAQAWHRAIYVWPWVLLTTALYAYRADKFGLNAGLRGIIAYDLLSIRVAALPFLAAITLPLLNFAFNPHAPELSLPIVLLVSGVSWWLHDLIAVLLRQRRNQRL